MKKINIFLLSASMILLGSCQNQSEEAHVHEHEEATLSYTIWTEYTELFVEFRPLVVGEKSDFAAHFSEMKNFKAITEGKVTVSLISGDSGIRHTVDAPSSPGLFRPALEPTKAGLFDLLFEIETANLTDEIRIKDIEVYATRAEANEANPVSKEDSNEITFLKEQSWNMDFENTPVISDTIYEVIQTGGEILPAQGDEKTLIATASGIVVYQSTDLIIGAEVSKNQSLFSVAGGNITNENSETQFLMAKSNYDRAKSTLERKEKLYNQAVISKPEYEKAKNEFELAEIEYKNLSANFSRSGKSIKANTSGYVKSLFKHEGEYVEAGEPLAILTQNKRLTIKADIGQKHFEKLNNSITANFKFNGQMYAIEDFNGRLLSFGKSVSREHPKIPVYFELDNMGNLLAGSFIDVWIKCNPQNTALKIPSSALLEDYGVYSVIVQNGGESFEKREIQVGLSDGIFVQVIDGLEEGERVVTKGAYQIKMASMS